MLRGSGLECMAFITDIAFNYGWANGNVLEFGVMSYMNMAWAKRTTLVLMYERHEEQREGLPADWRLFLCKE